jgi:aryl-alcohol dehydrogenase-like predicted oxidoreductase
MSANMQATRRAFLEAAAGAAGSSAALSGQTQTGGEIPRRPFGQTGAQISALGLGGFHLGSATDLNEARTIVDTALDAGINFFDNAWEYHDGRSEEWLGAALKQKRDRAFLMTKVCAHGRSRNVAMRMLEESLKRLQTDHLDLWQIHEAIYDNDPDLIFKPDGAAEALAQAKKDGKVRFVGFTGHKDPSIHLRILAHGFPFDAVQMPLNCCDASFRSFEEEVLPEVNRRGMAALGMKSMGGSGELVRSGTVTAAEALSYAMSLPVAVTISGMESVAVLKQNLEVACGFKPLGGEEMARLRDGCRRAAADGRWELFKTTTKYDGAVGREQHGFPNAAALPA